MNNQYNSDKIWQDKLGNHAMKTPMHLFDRIDQKRTFSYKVRNQIRLHRSKFVVSLLLLFLMCGGVGYWVTSDVGQVTSDVGQVTSDVEQVTSDVRQVTSDVKQVTSDVGLVTSDVGQVTDDLGQVMSSIENVIDSKIAQKNTTAQKRNTKTITTGGITDFMDSKISQHNTIKTKQKNTRTTNGITDFMDSKIVQSKNTQRKTTELQNSSTTLKETTALRHYSTTALKETLTLKKLPTEKLSINLPETTTTPDNGCTNFNQRPKTKFTIDVLAWGNYNDRKLGLQNNATAESNDYITQRENTETSRYGIGGGVRVSIDLPIEISLRTGLFYNQIHERFDLVDTNASRTIIYIDNLTGISDTLNETGTRIMETYNYYRLLDIPVMVGYTFKKGNIYAGINGGVLFNILLKQKGHILKADNQPTLITNNSNSEGEGYFKDNIGLQLYGSIEFGYKLNDRIDFLIEPHVKHMLNSITQYNHPLSQKYTTYGFAGGLRFKF